MVNEKLLSDCEAADRLRMLPARLVRLAKAGKIPCVILPDNEVRFSEADLTSWIETFKRPAQGGASR